MEKAVERIIKAIKEKENVTIYGDYDVDGITSITVLKSFLQDRGLEVNTYIPNRLDEGYGLNNDAISKIAKTGCQLMITVDCGISAIEEIEYANSLGIETVITDHHEPVEELPKAFAVIDNKRKDSTYPFRELAGVGVVFKLIQAISIKLNLKEEEYLKYLDIVCIGTISDIVPLVDENRVITKLGLMLVKQTKNIGLKAILQVSGYNKIDSNTISFGIAPRINACGRMGVAGEALDLFLSKNINQVNELARKLNERNRVRQEMMKQIKCLSFAVVDIAEYLDTHPDDRKAICLHKEYCNQLEDIKDKYQRIFGPLTIYYPCNKWRWLEEPWPWERSDFNVDL